MRSLNRKIEKFCYKHPRFGIPNFMLIYVIASAVVFLLCKMDTTNAFLELIYFSPMHILRGQIWRLVTWIFWPSQDSLIFEAIMLLFYYSIGGVVQRQMGTPKFTIYYLLGVIINIVYGFLIYFIADSTVFINATYINLSLFFVYAVLYPENRVYIFFILPVKVKWLAYFDAAYYAYMMIRLIVSGYVFAGLLPLISVINFLLFFGEYLLSRVRRSAPKYNASTINFKRAARAEKRKVDSQPYRHKCSVCGRTDASNPELEFRYCSRCKGYHCFCMEHINNHIHFTE
ncbi:MAG: hypothetical protein IJ072_05785 [Oscillospiraceae bacterium]|nr:hypothetical protein [Oscillospiraceae bacterium]